MDIPAKELLPNREITKDKILQIISTGSTVNGHEGFISAMGRIYSNEDSLLSNGKKASKAWLSNGVSLRDMFYGYIDQINKDLNNHTFYKFYDFPSGNQNARHALTIFENQKFNKTIYTKDHFCLTEGATGAISAVFEVFKSKFPEGEIVIPSPSYYIFRFIAQRRGIPFREICTISKSSINEMIAISMQKILDSISEKTKLIILSQPTNPSGEIYSTEQISQLLKTAKEKGIWVLFDEVFFDLIYNPTDIKQSDLIAYDEGVMSNIVIVKSFSKNRNMPAFRMGYVFSKIDGLAHAIGSILEEQVCLAVGSNFQQIIIQDSFYSTVLLRQNLNPKKIIQEVIAEVRKEYEIAIPTFQNNDEQLTKGFLEFSKYINDTINYYMKNFTKVCDIIESRIGKCIVSKSGFNAFIRINKLDNVNSFDFMLNLYLSTGIMIQPGPYFGFSQKMWDEKLGFWLRITYGTDISILESNLRRLNEFVDIYLKHSNRYIHTDLVY